MRKVTENEARAIEKSVRIAVMNSNAEDETGAQLNAGKAMGILETLTMLGIRYELTGGKEVIRLKDVEYK